MGGLEFADDVYHMPVNRKHMQQNKKNKLTNTTTKLIRSKIIAKKTKINIFLPNNSITKHALDYNIAKRKLGDQWTPGN